MHDVTMPTHSIHSDVEAFAQNTDPSFSKRFEQILLRYNLETRGIERVLPEDRHSLAQMGYIQVAMLWFSVNLTANNITLGMLGPAIFRLNFTEASLCAVSGMVVGVLPVAYISTFGPRSGLRTMAFARFSMGWYSAKLLVVLNIIMLLGYSLVTVVIAGQIISAVSATKDLTITVGIIIVSVLAWILTTFGYSVFHLYERYAWISQILVVSVLAGVAGPTFDLNTDLSRGADALTVKGNRLSFFSLCLAAAITYSGGAADMFVYYPESSSGRKVFAATASGLVASFAFSLIIGIGLGSGTANDQTWNDAFSASEGALIVEAFRPLGTFGSVCSIIVALGLVSNIILPVYTSGVSFQTLGKCFERVPRVVWNTVGVIAFTVCAIVGRSNLAEIFTNFLALMGYWVSIWIAILLEEHILFRKWLDLGWEWRSWDNRFKLPVGMAACVAFVVGWAGSILCMAQVWYIGPLATKLGKQGGDMGNYVGFLWASLVFPGLRWLELRHYRR